MSRPDANAIGLRALRAVLDAAHDFEFDVGDKHVSVSCTPQPASAWPRLLEGLNEATDGPWPTPVDVRASWGDGSSEINLSAAYWQTNDHLRHLVGLRAALVGVGREMMWATFAYYARDADDGTTVGVPAAITTSKREEGETKARRQALNGVLKNYVLEAGIPLHTTWYARLLSIGIPSGHVEPEPGIVFERAVIIALLKHPFFERSRRRGFTGAPLVDVSVIEDAASPSKSDDARRAGIGPLPGGVRSYADTLQALVRIVADNEPVMVSQFEAELEQVYEITGKVAKGRYLRTLCGIGFVSEDDGELSLTASGRVWLEDPTPAATFAALHAAYTGLLEPLVLASIERALPKRRFDRIITEALGASWTTGNQVGFRRNWLLSLGLTERTREGDRITPAGAAVLATHRAEADEMTTLLQELLRDPMEEPDVEAVEDDDTAIGDWDSPHLDLRADDAGEHLGSLRLPHRVLEQACAALSAGKHLLLVGPPGTGKTELAFALANAAEADGYCTGLFGATASADWTTFDTIGGYALQSNSELAFRRGVFLQALHAKQWLLIDELNRADIDRAFGELMTVLSGKGTDTAFEEDGALVSIGPEEDRRYRVPGSFRVIATMNTWDKTSLFRLSYAVQRRFAMVTVGIPDDLTYSGILERAATKQGVLPPLEDALLPRVRALFSRSGLLGVREIGPAVPLDIVRYLRRRRAGAVGLAEAIEMYVLPQLEGLDAADADKARARCLEALGQGASEDAVNSLEARFREIFPLLEDPE